MDSLIDAARRQLARFEAAAVRDGVQDEPRILRFQAALALRVLALEARRRRETTKVRR